LCHAIDVIVDGGNNASETFGGFHTTSVVE